MFSRRVSSIDLFRLANQERYCKNDAKFLSSGPAALPVERAHYHRLPHTSMVFALAVGIRRPAASVWWLSLFQGYFEKFVVLI
jgi:hypothetical protein